MSLGPPGTGKTHLAVGLGVQACQAGHRTAFATAAEWDARLAGSSMLADLGGVWFGCTRHTDAGAHPEDDGLGLSWKSILPVGTLPVLVANLGGSVVVGEYESLVGKLVVQRVAPRAPSSVAPAETRPGIEQRSSGLEDQS